MTYRRNDAPAQAPREAGIPPRDGGLPPMPFTPETLAQRWDCSPEHVRALCKTGRLDHFRVGRSLFRIPVAAVAAFEAASNATAGDRPEGKAARKEQVYVPRIVRPL